MTMRVDLLVHAGAASKRSDDDRYIAQAKSYLVFEGRRVNVQAHVARQILEADHATPTILARTRLGLDDSTTVLDNTQLAYDALQSQLATSSLLLPSEYHYSPVAARYSNFGREGRDGSDGFHPTTNLDRPAHSESGSQHLSATSSAKSQSDEHVDSSYLKSPILNRSCKKRRLGRTHNRRSMSNKRVRSTYIPVVEHDRTRVAYIGSQPLQSTEWHDDGDPDETSHDSSAAAELTSELPTTYSLSNITTESYRTRMRSGTSQPSSRNCRTSSAGSSPIQVRASVKSMERPEEPRDRLPDLALVTCIAGTALNPPMGQVQSEAEEEPILASSPGTERQPSLGQSVQGSAHAQKILQGLSTMVRPPEPKTSQAEFTSHITESLRFLAENLDMEKRYKPITVAREVRVLERGYWLVNCSSWELAAQIEFWQFIETLIQRGNAGWGVWCARGEEDDRIPTTHSQAASSLGTVKVFCWGEVLKHIYLMLYVASKAKVRKLGLQWIDAEGVAIVCMGKG